MHQRKHYDDASFGRRLGSDEDILPTTRTFSSYSKKNQSMVHIAVAVMLLLLVSFGEFHAAPGKDASHLHNKMQKRSHGASFGVS